MNLDDFTECANAVIAGLAGGSVLGSLAGLWGSVIGSIAAAGYMLWWAYARIKRRNAALSRLEKAGE